MGGDHHPRNPAAEPRADQDIDAIKKARIGMAYRDKCAHLLIPLNHCRRENWFLPTRCVNERHTYEECQYYLWLDRVKMKQEKEKEKHVNV